MECMAAEQEPQCQTKAVCLTLEKQSKSAKKRDTNNVTDRNGET